MSRNIYRIKLYVKDTDKAHSVEKDVKDVLLKHKFELNDKNFDLEIAIGGDGSFIKMLRANNYKSNVYYSAINGGSLGFLSAVDRNQINGFIESINSGNYQVKDIDLLRVLVYSKDNYKELFCVNDFTLRKNDFSTMKADIFINDKLLENFNGDGLVFNTTIGSTAYNQALGGSVIDTDIKAISMIPIAPINNKVYHALSNSIIISNNKKITIIPKGNNNLCYLSDGLLVNDNTITKIECYLDKSIQVILPKDYNYFEKLKSKIIDSGD